MRAALQIIKIWLKRSSHAVIEPNQGHHMPCSCHRYYTPYIYQDWKRHVPLHICNSEGKVDPSCTFSGHMKWSCLVCHLFKDYADSTRQERPVPYSFKLFCAFMVRSNLFLVAVLSDWPFLAMRTSPGKRKQPTLMASALKVVAYSEVVHCRVE